MTRHEQIHPFACPFAVYGIKLSLYLFLTLEVVRKAIIQYLFSSLDCLLTISYVGAIRASVLVDMVDKAPGFLIRPDFAGHLDGAVFVWCHWLKSLKLLAMIERAVTSLRDEAQPAKRMPHLRWRLWLLLLSRG